MEKQRLARQAALVKQLECGCPDSTCADGKSCSHPMRRITSTKTANEKRQESNNQVSSTTPNVLIGSRVSFYCQFSNNSIVQRFNCIPKLYSRWVDRRGRDQLTEITNPTTSNGPIHFQVIPSSSQTHNISNQLITRTNSNINNPTNQPQQQLQLSNIQTTGNHTNLSNSNNPTNNSNINNSNNSQMTINTSNHNNTNKNINNNNGGTQLTAASVVTTHSNQISLTGKCVII